MRKSSLSPFSKVTVFMGLFIIVSASFMRQVVEFLKIYFGERGIIISIGLVLIIIGLVFLISSIRNNSGFKRTPALVILLTAGLALAWRIELPIERIHILEYGFLGWFASRDLRVKNKSKSQRIILAWALTVAVGILDEAFQRILPYRVWDRRDILFNTLGGGWGIGLYWLGTR